MKKTITFKKALTFLVVLSMLLCCVGAFGSIQASAATDRVSMYLRDPYFSKYGMSGSYIYVQTKDNASNQQVYVHYYYSNNEWKDAQAEYLMTLDDGSKIWKAYIIGYGTEYAIKYVADGQVIWDNNDGKNYTDQLLGTAPITVNRNYYYMSLDNYDVNVTLQNYGYQKEVVVRYTDNNWASYTDVPLSYDSTNQYGKELWSTELHISNGNPDAFEYCVYYKVNGKTYWANNFGENYNASYYRHP